MDLQTMFNWVAGAAFTIGGWFARQLWDAMAKLRQDLHKLEVALPERYVSKPDLAETLKEMRQNFNENMREVKDMLSRIDSKIDGKADKH